MQIKDDTLIAYNNLKKRIIDHDFCTLCGSCEVACPTDALQIENEKVIRSHDCSQDLDLCPICYAICPHSEALLLRALRCISDAPKNNEALGYYRKIVIAQAVDPKLREKSHGGGVAAALLDYGVKKKIFDSTVYSQAESKNPSNPHASTDIIEDDILSAVKRKFFIASVANAYGSAVYGHGKQKIAYVGIPCHTLALRKMEVWKHKIVDNLAITIGLFCFGAFSLDSLMDYITKKYKIQPSEIKKMQLSTDFEVQTTDKTIRIPISEVAEHLRSSCRTCMDFTAELSDISVGAAHPLDDWSTVIMRTKAGEDLFNEAVENKVITVGVMQIVPEVFERLVNAAMQKRNVALQAAKSMEHAYGYLPVLLLRETTALTHVKVEDIMTKNVQTVAHNATITQLLQLMAQHHRLNYPVLDNNGEFLGVVTLEDASQVDKCERDTTPVSKIIHRKPVTVKAGETALDAFRKMSAYETGRVLVVDSTDPKKVLGIVTKTDLMHIMIQQ